MSNHKKWHIQPLPAPKPQSPVRQPEPKTLGITRKGTWRAVEGEQVDRTPKQTRKVVDTPCARCWKTGTIGHIVAEQIRITDCPECQGKGYRELLEPPDQVEVSVPIGHQAMYSELLKTILRSDMKASRCRTCNRPVLTYTEAEAPSECEDCLGADQPMRDSEP